MISNSHPTTPPIVTLLIISLIAPTVRADQYCYSDAFGNIICENRLSTGARIGIAIGIFAIIFGLIMAVGVARRRRIQQYNLSYIAQHPHPTPGYPQQYNQGNPGYFGQDNYGAPQYPPKTYPNGTIGYDNTTLANQSSHYAAPPVYAGYGPPPGQNLNSIA